MSYKEDYSLGEEIANSITHGLGAALSVAGLTLLVTFASFSGDGWHLASVIVYGTSMILLYLASTLYHSLRHPGAKRLFKILDHSAIYLLIAGTYTPFLLVNMRGVWGWSLFGVIWGLALLGIVFKIFFIEHLPRASTFAYIGMGWLCVVALPQMLETIDAFGMTLLVIGGISYTLGAGFYLWHRLPYNHAIWHLFVLGGSTAHYFAVFFSVLPPLEVS
jgi:hemolysin III